MEPELVAEFDRVLSKHEPEAIEWAFISWRNESQFNPPISEILKRIREWQRGQREQAELRARMDQKFALEEGRKQGLVPEFADVIRQVKEMAASKGMGAEEVKLHNFNTMTRIHSRDIPTIAKHMTPDQMAARLDMERAEIEHYRKIEQQTEGIYEDGE